MTWPEVHARRLERHALAAPAAGAAPADIAAAMAGVHAQVLSAAELGIALRIDGATRTDVRHALWTDRSLVKTYGPRGTVHLLATRDLPMWTAALSAVPVAPSTQPDDIRLTPAQTEEVVAAIADALLDAELTIDELSAAVVARTGPWAGDLVMPAFQTYWPRWRQAMHLAGMRGALCFAPNRGRKVTYTNPHRHLTTTTPAAAPGARPAAPEPEAALAELLGAYLNAYGPATPRAFAHWLNTPVTWAADLFASQGDRLTPVDVEGTTAWVAAGDIRAPAEPPSGVRLLPYFDTYAYRVGNLPPDRLATPEAAPAMKANHQLLLVDGLVAGRWHQQRTGRNLALTVAPATPLSRHHLESLESQATRLGEILEATPTLTLGQVTTGGHA
jgi:hypothetical protein